MEQLVLADPDISGVCRTDYLQVMMMIMMMMMMIIMMMIMMMMIMMMQVTGGVANSGGVPTLCGTNSGQHLIYSAIPNFPARLSVVVDNQVMIVMMMIMMMMIMMMI